MYLGSSLLMGSSGTSVSIEIDMDTALHAGKDFAVSPPPKELVSVLTSRAHMDADGRYPLPFYSCEFGLGLSSISFYRDSDIVAPRSLYHYQGHKTMMLAMISRVTNERAAFSTKSSNDLPSHKNPSAIVTAVKPSHIQNAN